MTTVTTITTTDGYRRTGTVVDTDRDTVTLHTFSYLTGQMIDVVYDRSRIASID